MTYKTLIEKITAAANELASSRLIQFGRTGRRYLGAEFLPETLSQENAITEVRAALATVIAADGGRYSPAQKARMLSIVPVSIVLGHQDISTDLTPEDFDALHAAFASGDDLQAQATGLSLVERALLALAEKNELQRWEGIGYGAYSVVGANGQRDSVPMALPEGHRVEFGGDLASEAFDAAEAFDAVANLLQAAGKPLARVVMSTPMAQAFVKNPAVREWLGGGFVNLAKLKAAILENYGARVDTYDLYYTDQAGNRKRFLRPDAIVLFGQTGDQVGVTWEDEDGEHELLLENTVGRVWIGRAAKQSRPGRAVTLYTGEGKAAGLTVDAWQTSAAGLLSPDAVAVITTKSESESES